MNTDIKTATKNQSIRSFFTAKSLSLIGGVLTASILITACSDDSAEKVAAVDTDAVDTSAVDTNNNTETVESSIDNNTKDTAELNLAPNTPEPTIANTNSLTENTSDRPNDRITDNEINPLTNNQPSLVTNPTEAGTPEDTVKQALNTLYYGDVADAVDYYRVDMANFESELANTQSAFQQTVESVTITNTQYSVDKTKATITGELRLKGQSEPAPLTYQLQKVNGQWKILG